MRPAADLPLRQNRNFRLVWLGGVLSSLGSTVSFVAYPLLAVELTGSAATAGIVSFARLVPLLVFALPAGVLVDRVDRRRVMMVSDALGAAAVLTVAMALWLHHLSVAQLMIVAFLDGTFFMFFTLAEAGAMPHIVPGGQLPDAVAQNTARESAAALVGPPLGGALFGIGRSLPFVADAVSYMLSLIGLAFVRGDFRISPHAAEPRLAPWREATEGMAWVWSRPFLRASLLQIGGTNVVGAAMTLTMILVAREHGASAGAIGGMLGVVAAGSVLGAVAAPLLYRRLSAPVVVLGYAWLGVAAVGAMSLTTDPILLGAALACWRFFGPAWDAVVVGYRIQTVPDQLQGRAASIDWLLSMGMVALGPLLAGYMVESLGGRDTTLLFATWTLVVAIAGTLTRSLRTFPLIIAGGC